MTKDLHTNIAVVSAIATAVLSADETGAALDRQGFDSAAFAIVTGAVVGAGDFAARMQHSDTETPGDFALEIWDKQDRRLSRVTFSIVGFANLAGGLMCKCCNLAGAF